MRKLKQVSLAVALVFVLGTGAVAGIVECPPAPAPPPPSAMGTVGPSPNIVEPTNSVADLVLAVLRVLLVF